MSVTEGNKLKQQGMALAAKHRKQTLQQVKEYLRDLANTQAVVSADDAFEYVERMGLPALGNAAGSLFRGPEWQMTGWVPSRRTSNHAHKNRCYVLSDAKPVSEVTGAKSEPVKPVSPTQYKRERDALEQMYECGSEFNGEDGSDRYDRACEHLRRGLEAWYAQ